MEPLNIYTSDPADNGLAGIVLALGQNLQREVHLRPLEQLPVPDPERRQALRVEREEIVESIHRAEWCLAQYRGGHWHRDASHENGLAADLDALLTRRRAIDRILGAEKGGVNNG